MNRIGLGRSWLACVFLVAGGCGAFPDFLLDAGRDAVQESYFHCDNPVRSVFRSRRHWRRQSNRPFRKPFRGPSNRPSNRRLAESWTIPD